MTEFVAAKSGESEAQWRQFMSHLFAQVSVGKAATGVLTGLVVAQTGTASGSVLIGAGAGVAQASTGDGASPLVNPSQVTLDIFTANPMGGTPRNDVVVFDAATATIRVLPGTPNAVPTDPTAPTSAVALARLRHAASATTIPTAKIDDLRSFTTLASAVAAPTVTAGGGVSAVASGSFVDGPAFTAGGTERYKVTVSWFSLTTTIIGTTYEVRIMEGGSGGTVVGSIRVRPDVVATGVMGGTFVRTHVPGAGPRTYSARIERIAGTGVVSVSTPIELLVERLPD